MGWYISGIGHGALILFLLFGGLFMGDRIPEPISVSEVSVISEEEFAALSPPGAAPNTQTDVPDVTPPEPEAAPETPREQAAPVLPETTPVEAPEAPDTPDIEVPDQIVPEAVIVDTAPPMPAPPSELDGTTTEPDAVAAPAPRVAPLPQVAPPPKAETAPELIEDTAPDPEAPPAEQPEPQEPAAPEEASDRIVTEAEEEKTYAPASSMRPRSRPPKPVRTVETPREQPTPAPQQSSTDDAVAAALSETPSEEPVRQGPPLTGGEKDAFRVAVGGCWVVDSGGQSSGVKVTVAFSLDREGKVAGDIRQIRIEGGDAAAQRTAFEKARRAILRCQKGGYPLPVEKYDQWRDIEATFNPQGMQYK